MENKVLVSIIVPTFNHERYIEKALDSILKQKVNFNYEVLIGEDCSTDSTRIILQNLERYYDKRFKFYYRDINSTKNRIGMPFGNVGDLMIKTRGKYIITLEGDDYWIDENKLQVQVDFLEANPDYYACAHRCVVVDENNKVKDEVYPSSDVFDYNIEYIASDVLPGQTATFMYRNPFICNQPHELDFLLNPNYYVGDRRNVFFAATHGKIACFKEYLSAYRHVLKGGASFSANNSHEFNKEYPHYRSFCDYCRRNNINGVPLNVSEFMLFFYLLKSLIRRKIDLYKFYRFSRDINNKSGHLFRSIIFIFRRLLRKKICY